MTQQTKWTSRKPKRLLLILLFLFLAPGLLAIVFFRHTEWLSLQATNKGTWVKPPQLVVPLQAKQWHLVLWSPSSCHANCLEKLDKLARIRLALGRRWYDVDTILLQPDAQNQPLSDKTVRRVGVSAINIPLKPTIFIANPQGYLILSYPITAPSDDIFHDIKQLIVSHSE